MTRFPLLTLSAVLAFAGAAEAQECKLPRARDRFDGVVIRVVDGDTAVVSTATCSALHVRLADFDSPERNELGGARATAVLTAISLGRQVECKSAKGRSGNYRSYGRA